MATKAAKQPVLSVLSIVIGTGALITNFLLIANMNTQLFIGGLCIGAAGLALGIVASKKEKATKLWLVGIIVSAAATGLALLWTVFSNFYVFLLILQVFTAK